MSSAIVAGGEARGPGFFFDRAGLGTLALARRGTYLEARPYPHAVFDGLLGEPLASALAAAVPRTHDPRFSRRDFPEQRARLSQRKRTAFDGLDPLLRHFLNELTGMAFLDFLGSLTGVRGLIADPHFRGAGLSLTLPGGHLALHADFNRDRTRNLHRTVTVLYYLGGAWSADWGGDLELWNHPPTRCEARYAPVLDRLVVMAHGETFWHGHPEPLTCPPGRARAALAAYYYVAPEIAGDDDAHGAIWAAAVDAVTPPGGSEGEGAGTRPA